MRHLAFLARQLVAYTVQSRRPGLLLVVVLGGIAAAIAIAVQVAVPAALYPFI